MSNFDLQEERRKVQFTGGSTYTVSLPKKWIIQNQLKRGSLIRLRQEEDGLLVIVPAVSAVPEKKSDEATIKITLKDTIEGVARKTISIYLTGYNTILIKTDKQKLSGKQRQELKTFVRRMLVGTEIVTDTPSEISLQVLVSYPELTIQSALRRMSIIASSMHKDAVEALKTRDEALSKDIISTGNEVNRFYLYVVRQLKVATLSPKFTKKGNAKDNFFSGHYYLISKSIERTADHAAKIAENALALKQDLNQEVADKIAKMSTSSVEMFEKAVESLFRQDYHMADSILQQNKEISVLEKEAIVLCQVAVDDAANLRLVIESIKRTAENARDIAESVLNLTIESILA